jgi:intermembrane space import and assembly protein 40
MGSEISAEEVKEEEHEVKEEPPEESKDSRHKALFLTPEEAAEPSKVQLGEPEDHPPGLILPSGEINWNCPCLGGMAIGPCGIEFREAFSCFHYSEAEPKGSDCLEQFAGMQRCMQSFPELFEDASEKKEKESKEEEEILQEKAKEEEPLQENKEEEPLKEGVTEGEEPPPSEK